MISITIKYGVGDEITKAFEDGITVGQVMANQSVKIALGYGDNVRGLIDGVEQPSSMELSDGDVLNIETRANQKAINQHELVLA
jgi:hypothetical protein